MLMKPGRILKLKTAYEESIKVAVFSRPNRKHKEPLRFQVEVQLFSFFPEGFLVVIHIKVIVFVIVNLQNKV